MNTYMSGNTLYIVGEYSHQDILDLDSYLLNDSFQNATAICIRNVYADKVIHNSLEVLSFIDVKFKKCVIGEYITHNIRRLDVVDSKIKRITTNVVDILNLSYSNIHMIDTLRANVIKVFSCNIGIISRFLLTSSSRNSSIKKSSIGVLYGANDESIIENGAIRYCGKFLSIKSAKVIGIDYNTDSPSLIYEDIPSELYDKLVMLFPYSI